jgi:hypothetical protein
MCWARRIEVTDTTAHVRGGAIVTRTISKKVGDTPAVLGYSSSGKSHLLYYMLTGHFPPVEEKTQGKVKLDGRKLIITNSTHITVRVNDTNDVGGDSVQWGDWRDVFGEADFIVYLIRCDLIDDGEYKVRLLDDAKHIESWRNQKPFAADSGRNKDFILIITYCDTDPNYEKTEYESYREFWRTRPEIARLLPYFGPANRIGIVAGSLKTESEAAKVVYRIYKQLY